MTPGFLAIFSLLAAAQLFLPRRWAFLPLVIGACHLGNIEVVGELTPTRILILLGVTRALIGGFFRLGTTIVLDRVFLAFAFVAILSAVGHPNSTYNPWIARAGLVYNVVGVYVYGRCYLRDFDSLRRVAVSLPVILMPLAAALLVEKSVQRNVYAYVGSGSLTPMQRDDKVRAQGPFRHAILAGCAGATALPFAFLLLKRKKRLLGIAALGACFAIVISCASSGPLAAVGVSFVALIYWRRREKVHLLLYAGLFMGAFYWIVAGRGPWYIMASIDLVGGSTGWHRAKLFDQGYKYLSEWWLFGTDYTRHWMATGVSWSRDHVDITNYYLHLGVIGGIVLPLLVVVMIGVSLYSLERAMRVLRGDGDEREYAIWCLGAAICTHAISFVSISYFDQMYVLFYLMISLVPGVCLDISRHNEVGELGGVKLA